MASVDGVITGVGTNNLGGNVAFLADNKRNIRLYYAHLDRWNVAKGSGYRLAIPWALLVIRGMPALRVRTCISVSMTYRWPPNPLPFIRLGRGPAAQPLLSPTRLGDSIRVVTTSAALRLSPDSKSPTLLALPKSAALTLLGGTETWLRVELPNGLTGYVASNAVETEKRPLRQLTLTSTGHLLDAADQRAARIDTLQPGSSVEVMATMGTFQLVRSETGQTGWLSASAATTN